MMDPNRDESGHPLQNVGRVLDSRWMMAFAVLAVLVAIAWALLDGNPSSRRAAVPGSVSKMATVELLGAPEDAVILLDGRAIESPVFGVTPGTRHALEVTDSTGRSWRQVFLADGSLSLVVELRTHFEEVDVSPTGTNLPKGSRRSHESPR